MQLTFKTLQQKQFKLDADPSDTVAGLKQKIQEDQGFAVDLQKIIYSGKVLNDEQTVESCKIKEKDFLVVMVSKPKPAPSTPKPAAEPSTSSASTSTPTPAPSAAPSTSAPALEPTSAPSEPVATDTTSAPAAPAESGWSEQSSFVSGPALQSAITQMVAMGFEREHVMRALKASFNNPDRAVEYLFNGIPEHLVAESVAPAAPAAAAPPAAVAAPTTGAVAPAPAAAPVAPAPAADVGQPTNLFQAAAEAMQRQSGGAAPGGVPAGVLPSLQAGAGASGGAGGTLNPAVLDSIRQNPNLAQLRQLVAQNPAVLQQVIQQMAQTNPQLLQVMQQNPELLFQILGGELGGEGEGEGDWDGEGGEGIPGVTTIQVTPEENAAIERLIALGFPRDAVIQAYFACDKNEELAANMLFDSGFD